MNFMLFKGAVLFVLVFLVVGCGPSQSPISTIPVSDDSACSVFVDRPYYDAKLPNHLENSSYSKELLCQLSAWDALPESALNFDAMRRSWAETLHKNVVGKDWPPYLQETVAEMVERNEVTLGSALA